MSLNLRLKIPCLANFGGEKGGIDPVAALFRDIFHVIEMSLLPPNKAARLQHSDWNPSKAMRCTITSSP